MTQLDFFVSMICERNNAPHSEIFSNILKGGNHLDN